MLTPKSILITGGSSGIGRAMAESYAAPGVTLFLGGRNKDRLEEAAAACRAKGAAVYTAVVDVLDKIQMSAWIGGAHKTAPLDLVIANAGISGGTGGFAGESEEQTRAILATNVDGVIHTFFPALEEMRRKRPDANGWKGQIALMSSLAAFRGFPGAPAYCASKAMVKSLGEAWRGKLMAEGIAVNVLCPGYIKTPMTDANGFFMPFLMDAARAAQIMKDGLQRNKGRIAFPFPTFFMVWLLMALPAWMFDRLLSKLPEKPAMDGQ